jgi:cell division protein FtsW (lipid II flippase)
MTAWSISVFLTLVAVVLFIVALIVAVTDYGSHWAAWVSGGLIAFAAGHLPWRA